MFCSIQSSNRPSTTNKKYRLLTPPLSFLFSKISATMFLMSLLVYLILISPFLFVSFVSIQNIIQYNTDRRTPCRKPPPHRKRTKRNLPCKQSYCSKALAGLSELGYLDRKSGKGTFVAEKKLHRSITEVISFTDMCRMMNATAGAKTIKIALEEPSEREIKEMSLKPGEKILVLERIRYMDDEPVIIELNKFPESFSFLFGEDLNDTSLFEVLKKHNIILDHSRKNFRYHLRFSSGSKGA